MGQEEIVKLLRRLADGLGIELDTPLDMRKLRRLPDPSTPSEMRQRTTIKVTRYTLSQIRARCPPAMTVDAFIQQLLFLYDVTKNKGVILKME